MHVKTRKKINYIFGVFFSIRLFKPKQIGNLINLSNENGKLVDTLPVFVFRCVCVCFKVIRGIH